MRSDHPIPEVDALSPADFHAHHLATCGPVVVRGAARHWPALRSWSPTVLAERFGSMTVPCRRTPLDEPELSVETVHQGFFSIADLLQRCEEDSSDEVYVPGVSLRAVPRLCDDIDKPGFLGDTAVRSISGFFGRNTRCLGHMHPFAQAVLTQVVGSKEVLLYAPGDLHKLSMNPWWQRGFFQSRINFHALEPERFPRLRTARAHTVRLEPGDSLFLPVHWLHVPVGIGFAASVTHWWRSTPSQWGGVRPALRSLFGAAAAGLRTVFPG